MRVSTLNEKSRRNWDPPETGPNGTMTSLARLGFLVTPVIHRFSPPDTKTLLINVSVRRSNCARSSLFLSPIQTVAPPVISPQVDKKISELPSLLLPAWLLVELNAMRMPSALIEGLKLPSPVLLVIWVKLLVEVSKRKISKFPSLLVPRGSSAVKNAMRVPSALIEGAKF